jgi:disease resistance protein RPS2
MPDPSMISAALHPVCGFINNTGVPAATARQFSSFFCIKRNRRALTKANEYLQAFEKVVQEEVTREINQSNKCHPLVELWLRKVHGIFILVDHIDQECDQLMQYSCICNYSIILRKRYRLGKRVLRTLEDLGELTEEGNQFKVFGSKPLPDSVEDRPRIEAFGIETVLNNLRKYFNSSNVIGVWGPGGVGKTTLLNTFNNELKELGSDDQVRNSYRKLVILQYMCFFLII